VQDMTKTANNEYYKPVNIGADYGYGTSSYNKMHSSHGLMKRHCDVENKVS